MLKVKPSNNDKKIKNAILSRIKDAKTQADNIIIEIPNHIKRKQINTHIIGYLKQSHKKRIIIVKWKNKALVFDSATK